MWLVTILREIPLKIVHIQIMTTKVWAICVKAFAGWAGVPMLVLAFSILSWTALCKGVYFRDLALSPHFCPP